VGKRCNWDCAADWGELEESHQALWWPIGGKEHLELYGAETYFKQGEVMNYVVSVSWSKVKTSKGLSPGK
jgi:hypothetical protein